MNTVFIMLGSNTNPTSNLDQAKDNLALYFQIDACSNILATEPVGRHYLAPFLNIALKVQSRYLLEETKLILKRIEIEMGRTENCKQQGLIPIDIDLIFWNDDLLHRDYERFSFVKACVDQLRFKP
jgi:2-amino-4-hydroxy-6-hydroxymethyldihydropteridine diphosphokinase